MVLTSAGLKQHKLFGAIADHDDVPDASRLVHRAGCRAHNKLHAVYQAA